MAKPTKKEADVQLHLRVPRELAERLDAQVRARDLSAAQLVRAAIAAHLEKLEGRAAVNDLYRKGEALYASLKGKTWQADTTDLERDGDTETPSGGDTSFP